MGHIDSTSHDESIDLCWLWRLSDGAMHAGCMVYIVLLGIYLLGLHKNILLNHNLRWFTYKGPLHFDERSPLLSVRKRQMQQNPHNLPKAVQPFASRVLLLFGPSFYWVSRWFQFCLSRLFRWQSPFPSIHLAELLFISTNLVWHSFLCALQNIKSSLVGTGEGIRMLGAIAGEQERFAMKASLTKIIFGEYGN